MGDDWYRFFRFLATQTTFPYIHPHITFIRTVKKSSLKKILIVRTDRIGDVVLSLPMIPILRKNFPDASISFLLRSYTREIVEGQRIHAVLLYDGDGFHKKFFRMLFELRESRFDAVVVTSPTFRLALLMFLAGVRIRVGTGYRWYSFLFSERVFEHRKTAEKHESEYNLSLLKALGCDVESATKPSLHIFPKEEQEAAQTRKEVGLRENDVVVILHPGSGGSARDWSPRRFGETASRILEEGLKVVVTGGPGEEGIVSEVVRSASKGVIPLVNRLSLRALAAFIRSAHVFVSNSTGPLHIAAAVGTPVVAFFPPILQCSARRWGPLSDRKIVFEPDRNQCPRCHGGPCQANECMDLIRVEQVVEAVLGLVHRSTKRGGKFAAA